MLPPPKLPIPFRLVDGTDLEPSFDLDLKIHVTQQSLSDFSMGEGLAKWILKKIL